MCGGLIGRIGGIAGAFVLVIGVALGAAAEQSNPRAIVYQLIDQLQTGQPRPVDLAPAVRKLIAEQTGATGMYPALAQLGIVTYVRIELITPMQRGTVYSMTATHEKGVSTWQVGLAADTQRVEYVEFKIAKSSAAPPQATARSPEPQATTKPVAPRADATPQPSHPPTPSAAPSAAPPAAPAPAPRTASPADTSAACRKFPNLC